MKVAAHGVERLSNSLGKSTVRSFLLQPFLDLRSWGQKNCGILVLASLKYHRYSLQLSILFKKMLMNHNLKNSVLLWVKNVQGCLAGVLYSAVLVLKRFAM